MYVVIAYEYRRIFRLSVALLRSAIFAFQNVCVSPEFLNKWSLFLKQWC